MGILAQLAGEEETMDTSIDKNSSGFTFFGSSLRYTQAFWNRD